MSNDKPAGPAGRAPQAGQPENATTPPEAARKTAATAEPDRATEGDRTAEAASATGSRGGADTPADGTADPSAPLIPADREDEKAARVLQDRIDDSIGAAGAGPAA